MPPPASTPDAAHLASSSLPLQVAIAKNMAATKKVPEFRVSMAICTDELDALYKVTARTRAHAHAPTTPCPLLPVVPCGLLGSVNASDSTPV